MPPSGLNNSGELPEPQADYHLAVHINSTILWQYLLSHTHPTYIWYIPPFKRPHSQKSNSSVSDTKSLQSIQGTVARYITGGIRGTAYDILEAHANLPPVNLLFRRVQFRAASRICTLPPRHPLYPIACHTAARFVRSHRSPLHYLFFITGLRPKHTETIDPVHQHPNYKPALNTVIKPNKESALTKRIIITSALIIRYTAMVQASKVVLAHQPSSTKITTS